MIEFFTDPVLRAPTLGSILMCLAASLMGVVIFLQKRSLLSEALSHSTYPGACIGVALFALLCPQYDEWVFLAILGGALLSSWAGLKLVQFLEVKEKVKPDAALCFVLSVFFGIGMVVASGMQARLPAWHKQVQMLLFGQAATMTDLHIWIYGSITALVVLFLFLFYPQLQAVVFDRNFSLIANVRVKVVERALFWLLLLSLVVGIRSVGVTLLSGMVVAPAIAARQYSNRLSALFGLAALFGAASGFVGNLLSVWAHLPTGPAIVLVGSAIALFSLLFAPKRGFCFRMGRVASYHVRCLEENILKGIWKRGSFTGPFSLRTRYALWKLKKGGWINQNLQLTADGRQKAASIVRLHRLWELYLTQSLGVQIEQVHKTAEEMEHILTSDMEERLTSLLANPKHDPHQQPIPEKGL